MTVRAKKAALLTHDGSSLRGALPANVSSCYEKHRRPRSDTLSGILSISTRSQVPFQAKGGGMGDIILGLDLGANSIGWACSMRQIAPSSPAASASFPKVSITSTPRRRSPRARTGGSCGACGGRSPGARAANAACARRLSKRAFSPATSPNKRAGHAKSLRVAPPRAGRTAFAARIRPRAGAPQSAPRVPVQPQVGPPSAKTKPRACWPRSTSWRRRWKTWAAAPSASTSHGRWRITRLRRFAADARGAMFERGV